MGVLAMRLCLERNNFSGFLEAASGTKLLEEMREGIPDPLPIAGISTTESSGQAPDKGSAEAIHAEQRGLKFVWCHGGGCGGARCQFTGFEKRSEVCCNF